MMMETIKKNEIGDDGAKMMIEINDRNHIKIEMGDEGAKMMMEITEKMKWRVREQKWWMMMEKMK